MDFSFFEGQWLAVSHGARIVTCGILPLLIAQGLDNLFIECHKRGDVGRRGLTPANYRFVRLI
jgi:hypothetical protein